MSSETQRYLDNGVSGPEYSDLAKGGQMRGLQYGLIFFWAVTHLNLKVQFLTHSRPVKGYLAFT